MTSRRFPIGLTAATAISLAILCGLGVWQLKRLAWKQDLLAHIEALKTATAAPLAPVLERAKRGEAVAWTRVSIRCQPRPETPDTIRYGLRDGEIVWRAVSTCGLDNAPFAEISVDRGFIEASRGEVRTPRITLPPLGAVTGVLVPVSALSKQSGFSPPPVAAPAPAPARPTFLLMAESEDPAPAGVTPAPLPTDIPNRHLEYALTWFGLAGALTAVYAALVRRRFKAP